MLERDVAISGNREWRSIESDGAHECEHAVSREYVLSDVLHARNSARVRGRLHS